MNKNCIPKPLNPVTFQREIISSMPSIRMIKRRLEAGQSLPEGTLKLLHWVRKISLDYLRWPMWTTIPDSLRKSIILAPDICAPKGARTNLGDGREKLRGRSWLRWKEGPGSRANPYLQSGKWQKGRQMERIGGTPAAADKALWVPRIETRELLLDS